MKSYFIFVPIFFLALLQGAFLPLNLVLLLVLVNAVWRPEKISLAVAFGAGLLLDLASSQVLGFSSLIFLAMVFLTQIYDQRFDWQHPLLLPSWTFFWALFYKRFQTGFFNWRTSLFLAFLVFIGRFYLEKIWGGSARPEIKLR